MKWDDEEDTTNKLHGRTVSDSDTDDVREAAAPQRMEARPTNADRVESSSSTATENGDAQRWLSMQGLLARNSPYVTFDGSRGYAYSPSKLAALNRPSTSSSDKASRLTVTMVAPAANTVPAPGSALAVNLNSLNLHLTLRAKEIVACSESMWDWVAGMQEGPEGQEARAALTQGGPPGSARVQGADAVDQAEDLYATRAVILDMTRDDFDRLLCNFEW